MVSRARRRNAFYLVLLAVLLAVIWASYKSYDAAGSKSEKSLTELLSALDQKQVASATLNADGNRVDWTDRNGTQYRTFYPVGYQLADRFREGQVPMTVTPPSSTDLWLTVLLPNILLFGVIGGFMFYMLKTTRRKEVRI
jgi:ATP-dependent Zn protease